MIITITKYSVECDHCGVSMSSEYDTSEEAENAAFDHGGFQYINGEHICDNCDFYMHNKDQH